MHTAKWLTIVELVGIFGTNRNSWNFGNKKEVPGLPKLWEVS